MDNFASKMFDFGGGGVVVCVPQKRGAVKKD